jgi:hypothetical protein
MKLTNDGDLTVLDAVLREAFRPLADATRPGQPERRDFGCFGDWFAFD